MHLQRSLVLATALGVLTQCAAAEEPARQQPTPEPLPAQERVEEGGGAAEVTQDPELLRWVSREASWFPGSTFEVVSDETRSTPNGDYRYAVVERSSSSRHLSGPIQVVVDLGSGLAWAGTVARLSSQSEVAADAIEPYLERFLPMALENQMRLRTEVQWDETPAERGAVVPFRLEVDSGYGPYHRDAAYTADGEYVILTSPIPLDTDPVQYRNEKLRASELVTWADLDEGTTAAIAEFSDYECPSCARKWPLIVEVLDTVDGATHGMTNLPLTGIHPWSFRAAAAGWCIGQQSTTALKGFKDQMYALQQDMDLSQVTPTALDFVAANGLDEVAFDACYLKDPSVEAVLGQLQLGYEMGVQGTPTYFVEGWRVQVPGEEWFPGFVAQVAGGEEPE